MSYKEFCEHLKQHPITITETAISEAVIKEYKQKQLDGVKMPCPRCGADRMRVPATYNALSRHIVSREEYISSPVLKVISTV